MSILSAIPAEFYTSAISAAISGILSIVAAKSKASAEAHQNLMEAAGVQFKSRELAQGLAKYADVRWTRRAIALSCVSSIVVFPMLAPLFGIDVTTGWTQLHGGFWPFTDPKEVMTWHNVSGGLVITPFHTHTVSAIIGYYFGASIVENARQR